MLRSKAENHLHGYATVIDVDVARSSKLHDSLVRSLDRTRFVPDVHAAEMMRLGGSLLAGQLDHRALSAIRLYGQGATDPVLLVRGLPSAPSTPATPFRGYNLDESGVAFVDVQLLGLLELAGITPTSYVWENLGRLFRNVVPNPDAANEASSHGYKEPLGWHTDNPLSRLEGFERDDDFAPMPRYLAFSSLRNLDAHGKAVPTDVLPMSVVVRRLPPAVLEALATPQFEFHPPASNSRTPAVHRVFVRRGHDFAIRYNTDRRQVTPLSPAAESALAELDRAIAAVEADVLHICVEPGVLLVFENYQVMHRRSTFDPGGDLAHARWLRRCFGRSPAANAIVDHIHNFYCAI